MIQIKKIISYALISIIALYTTFCMGQSKDKKPNIIIIFTDDMGYGDIGVFGHPTIRTPNMDQMAMEGQKWTNFYTAASVCTPSRAGLMTGRLPIRNGMCSNKYRVLFPDSKGGLPQEEITIAEKLKEVGYNTMHIGKWHLGHLPEFLPTSQGFDSYYGIPYSNDMDRAGNAEYQEACKNPTAETFQVPILRDTTVIERPAYQPTLTKRYTEEALKFISKNKKEPFFLYLAHSMPHVPLYRSEEFAEKSKRGLYGDVIEEIDWSVGQIMKTLKDLKLDNNTLVVFTSDNGPWLWFNQHGGSAGLLRDGKGSTFEGGMRVPTIFWWKDRIEPEVISDMGATLDIFPTVCKIAKTTVSKEIVYDGIDLSPTLFNRKESNRKTVFYYSGEEIYAYRKDDFKIHFKSKEGYTTQNVITYSPPLLYNLNTDPSEKYNIAAKHPNIIKKMKKDIETHKKTIKPVVNQLNLR